MSRSNFQHASEAIQLQRDTQPPGRPRDHLRSVHARSARDPPPGRRDARVLPKMR